MPKTMNRNSVDDVLIPVQLIVGEGATADPTDDMVQFQFTPGGLPPRVQPVTGEWLTGFWILDLGKNLAGITVGPGTTVVLTQGTYTIWIKVTDAPTAPVAAVDVLTIT